MIWIVIAIYVIVLIVVGSIGVAWIMCLDWHGIEDLLCVVWVFGCLVVYYLYVLACIRHWCVDRC